MAIDTKIHINLLSSVYHYAASGSEEDRNSLQQLVSLYLRIDTSSPQVKEMSYLLADDATYNPDKIRCLALEAIKALTVPQGSISASCSPRSSFSPSGSRRVH